MLFISDKSTVQCNAEWKIINKDVLDKKKKITYFSPGGYTFIDRSGKNICFDFCDSCGDWNDEGTAIETTQYSIDVDFITDSLKEDGYDDLVKEDYRLDFFKDFVAFDELHCTLDIDEEEFDQHGNVECIYFELFDPISEETLILINKKDKIG